MIRLLYISTARQPLTPEQLADVLRVSRRNNARVGVTGLLILGGRRFLQALEGPEEAVMTTYNRITADTRHFAVVLLAREQIETRQFAAWAMGAQAGGRAGEGGTISQAVDTLITPITDPSLRGYFTGFAERQAAA
ncbi:MAG: blue light sensor protein [Sphingomonas bacterium]|uniref:BLUF domain-containing protein n=1 Tax=Sphingomonas bacterium TaxID=1895847 RepID=UPI00260D2B4C|nr:BLUF domain-containing protein [Sphingomonas bacterium]MDB5695192.1 blue light sensor protein [Sphingomonas bacterium]